MNKRILRLNTCLVLMMLIASVTFQVQAQVTTESVDVVVKEDDGTERIESIDLPVSMTYPMDSLLSDWKIRNFVVLSEQDCFSSKDNPTFSDSVYIDRLSRMPTVMEMPYNEVVRRLIDM